MNRFFLWTAALMVLFGTNGCGSLTPPVTYYTLNSEFVPQGETTDIKSGVLTIGVRPVELPGYLNRLQMVTRRGTTRLEVSSLHRWADYPDRLVQQHIVENLQGWIPEARIVRGPWPVAVHPDLILSFQFLELVGGAGDNVVLNAFWTVSGVGSPSESNAYRTAVVAPIDGQGYDALAEAHSRALNTLARKVADFLKAQHVAH